MSYKYNIRSGNKDDEDWELKMNLMWIVKVMIVKVMIVKVNLVKVRIKNEPYVDCEGDVHVRLWAAFISYTVSLPQHT